MSLREALPRRTPERVLNALRILKREATGLSRLRAGLECPICGNRFRFLQVSQEDNKAEMLCLRCHSLERHRRQVLFLRRSTGLYTDRLKVLHIAPEPSLRRELEQLPNLDYVTADLYADDVSIRLDVTAIDFPDETFHVILCSHVLEHVLDDRAAMRELRRVLRRDGWALINVPSDPARRETYEADDVVDPKDRLKHFGQADHVRVYSVGGFLQRLHEAGLHVEVDPIVFSQYERSRYLLDGDAGWDHSYLCKRLD